MELSFSPQQPVASPIPQSPIVVPPTHKGCKVFVGAICAVFVVVVGYVVYARGARLWPFGANPTTCTAEAKLCPDGSSVGRIGPSCEFASCPSPSDDSTAGWKTHVSGNIDFSFRYPANATIREEVGYYMNERRVINFGFTGAALMGSISVDHPAFEPVQVAEPAASGAVRADGVAISYRTGLLSHELEGKPAGPERAWVGGFYAGGARYEFSFIADSGADNTELVESILVSFRFGADAAGQKTYTNSAGGYEFRYPPTVIVVTTANGEARLLGPTADRRSLGETGISALLSVSDTTATSLSYPSCATNRATTTVGDFSAIRFDGCDMGNPLIIQWIDNRRIGGNRIFTATIYTDRDLILDILASFRFVQ